MTCGTGTSYGEFHHKQGPAAREWEIVTIADRMTESVGDRIYLIRRALGPNARTELPLREFGELLSRVSGQNYDASELSKMERGKRGISLDDVAVIASVDPLRRGPGWLAFGEKADHPLPPMTPMLPPPSELLKEAAKKSARKKGGAS